MKLFFLQTEFNKYYDTPDEDVRRQKIYLDTIRTINEHNKLYNEGKMTYFLGVNQFADLTPDEIPGRVLLPPPKVEEEKADWVAYKVSLEYRKYICT